MLVVSTYNIILAILSFTLGIWIYDVLECSGLPRLFTGDRASTLVARAPSDEESSRPHKRIKLDDSELGKEADVVNLTKPTLGLVMDGWWFAKQYWDSMNGTIIGINYWGISMGHFNQPRWDNDGYESWNHGKYVADNHFTTNHLFF